MTSFLCDQVIDFDPINDGYEAHDVERLLQEIQQILAENRARKCVVLLRSAHYLTTKAFAILHDYICNSKTKNVVFVLVSTDKSKIFPPLLSLIENDSLNVA